MNLQSYTETGEFLTHCQTDLEMSEDANNLLLGISMNLDWFPKRVDNLPYLATVHAERRLVLAAVMTPPHNLVLSTSFGNLEEACQLIANDLAKRKWSVPGILAPSMVAQAFSHHYCHEAAKQMQLERQQWALVLRKPLILPVIPGKMRTATLYDLDLVATWENGFNVDIFGISDITQARASAEMRIADKDIFLWDDHGPRSMAMKTRPTRRGISISQVYTPPEFRGRGCATACMGKLSGNLLQSGWQFCSLFSETTNSIANHVYQKIGYLPVCDFDEIRFV